MKILRHYILREHIGPFVMALAVLTGLMLLNQLAKRFGDLVGKGLPWYLIGEVFALSIPFIVAMTMPMAVLVGVLYTFSRLSGDNEITAVKAGGISLLRFMSPVLLAATAVATTMVWFNDSVLPESNHTLRQLLSDIGRKQPTFELRERVVNEVVPGKLFLQAARIDRVRSVLLDLVIFDSGRPNVYRTIYADSGHMAFNATQTDLYLTLFDGSVHEQDTNDPGTGQTTYYAKQVIRVTGVTNELERGRGANWRGDREMNIEMMQAEVEKRWERILVLEDSLLILAAGLAPIRDPTVVTPPEEPRRERSATVDRSDRRLPRQVNIAPPSATPVLQEDAEDPAAKVRSARARFSSRRRAEWPPSGDAVAFAAQARAEFERLAARRKLQQREFNRYSVEIQKKLAIPAAAIIFVLIGAPIGVRFPRGGIGMVIGVSLAIFSVYYVFLIGGEDIADRGYLAPFWAMWAPNVIFGAVGVATLLIITRSGTKPRHRAILGWLRHPRLRRSRPSSDSATVRRSA
jgi:lipopolysaccharide export system permease protein